MYNVYTFNSHMGRKKREPTGVHGIRLPKRLWDLVSRISKAEYRSINGQVWKIVEDWLIEHGHMKDEDRKR